MMLPQLGTSGGVPAPRNDKSDSIRIAAAQIYVACTVSGARVLGKMWRNRILPKRLPTMTAAST